MALLSSLGVVGFAVDDSASSVGCSSSSAEGFVGSFSPVASVSVSAGAAATPGVVAAGTVLGGSVVASSPGMEDGQNHVPDKKWPSDAKKPVRATSSDLAAEPSFSFLLFLVGIVVAEASNDGDSSLGRGRTVFWLSSVMVVALGVMME